MSEVELLSCPFCGEKEEFDPEYPEEKHPWLFREKIGRSVSAVWWVRCEICSGRGATSYKSPEEAIKFWNRRPISTEIINIQIEKFTDLQSELISRMNKCAYIFGKVQGFIFGLQTLLMQRDFVAAARELDILNAYLNDKSEEIFYKDIEK